MGSTALTRHPAWGRAPGPAAGPHFMPPAPRGPAAAQDSLRRPTARPVDRDRQALRATGFLEGWARFRGRVEGFGEQNPLLASSRLRGEDCASVCIRHVRPVRRAVPRDRPASISRRGARARKLYRASCQGGGAHLTARSPAGPTERIPSNTLRYLSRRTLVSDATTKMGLQTE